MSSYNNAGTSSISQLLFIQQGSTSFKRVLSEVQPASVFEFTYVDENTRRC